MSHKTACCMGTHSKGLSGLFIQLKRSGPAARIRGDDKLPVPFLRQPGELRASADVAACCMFSRFSAAGTAASP